MRTLFSLLFISLAFSSFAQEIKILDSVTNEPVIGAHIILEDKGLAITDIHGTATINEGNARMELKVSHIGYVEKTITIFSKGKSTLIYKLQPNDVLLGEMVVTGSKYETSASRSTVSISLLSPNIIKRNNATSAEQVLQRIPGVEILDGQPSIRGGSGYSYGAGSRVLVLLDDIPILQADAGFPQWNDLPLELTGQIEVLKGASSSLYGSSALNGIINLRTDFAKSEPETGFFSYYTAFSSVENQKWWNENSRPHEFGYGIYHKEKIGKTDLVLGGFSKNLESFNKNTQENYKRITGSIKHKPSENLSLGLNFNVNNAQNSEFFFWKSMDSLFVPAKGTISSVDANRFNIDPNLTYFDKSNNRHKILSRYHYVNNQTNANRSNKSQLGYLEYQFYRKLTKLNAHITAGAVANTNVIKAELYGDTTFGTTNTAIYSQFDINLNSSLKLSFGARFENNILRTPEHFNCLKDPQTGALDCDTIVGGRKQEAQPVFRSGLNYQIAKATFLRASWGQGYRYPTVAEQFVKTTFGGIPISPNIKLESEKGWSTEIAIKQGLRIKKYEGFIDLAFFRSDYSNMIEFNFIDLTTTGFQSVNIGSTSINGLELVFAGKLESNNWQVSHLIGLNYLNPRFKEFDTSAVAYTNPTTEGQINAYNSSSRQNILKYRYRTTFKYDIELSYKCLSIGSSANYYSNMEAVDAIFEAFIVPGLKEFRNNNSKGNFIVNLRATYTANKHWNVSLLANNVLNRAYSLRPGLMEAPRNTSIRLSIKL